MTSWGFTIFQTRQSAPARDRWARVFVLVGLAVLAFLGGTLFASAGLTLGLMASAAGFAVIATGYAAFTLWDSRQLRGKDRILTDLVEDDPGFCFLTDQDSVLHYANAAARGRFSISEGEPLSEALRNVFASSVGVVYRLQNNALSEGRA